MLACWRDHLHPEFKEEESSPASRGEPDLASLDRLATSLPLRRGVTRAELMQLAARLGPQAIKLKVQYGLWNSL